MKQILLIPILFLYSALAWSINSSDYVLVNGQKEVSYNGSGEKKIEGSIDLYEIKSGQTITFNYDYYAPSLSNFSHNKLIVITPNIEGATPLEFLLKDYLQSKGFHVLIPHARPLVFTYDMTTVRQFETDSVRPLVGTTHIIELLSKTETFDSQSMGLLGASLGGIRSSILFGQDPRFRALFVAVAGADFPSIYAYSENSIIRPIRQEHMSYLGLSSQSTYESFLRGRLKLDPYMIVESPHLENVAMIIAEDDKIVPTRNQWLLWSAIKDSGIHPKTFISNTGHIAGALHLLRYRSDIFKWFKKRL